jgi:hypothetical protein
LEKYCSETMPLTHTEVSDCKPITVSTGTVGGNVGTEEGGEGEGAEAIDDATVIGDTRVTAPVLWQVFITDSYTTTGVA